MGHLLETFHERLSDLCRSDRGIDESAEGSPEEDCSESIRSLADSLGILEEPDFSFIDLVSQSGTLAGTEHVVELDTVDHRVSKITRPPGFGLYPAIRKHPDIHLPSGKVIHPERQVELAGATIRHYLGRWIIANRVFGEMMCVWLP